MNINSVKPNMESEIKLSLAIAPEGALPSAFVVFRDNLEASMKKAAALGYDGVELALLSKEQVNIKDIKRVTAQYNLEIPVVSTGQVFAEGGMWFTSDDSAIREKAKKQFSGLMDVAAEFGADINIGRLRGFISEEQTFKQAENNFIECLLPLADRAKELGIKILIEPVNRYEINYINSCTDGVSLLDKLELPEVKLMPDVFHMNIEDVNIADTLKRYKDYIGYVHFADNTRFAPGKGHLNFPEIINALKAVSYNGYIGVEILPKPTPDEAAEQAVKFLRKFL